MSLSWSYLVVDEFGAVHMVLEDVVIVDSFLDETTTSTDKPINGRGGGASASRKIAPSISQRTDPGKAPAARASLAQREGLVGPRGLANAGARVLLGVRAAPKRMAPAGQ